MLCLGLDSGTICKDLLLAQGVKCPVDLEICADGLESTGGGAKSATKKNRPLYTELRGRHADLTQKLVSSGYL